MRRSAFVKRLVICNQQFMEQDDNLYQSLDQDRIEVCTLPTKVDDCWADNVGLIIYHSVPYRAAELSRISNLKKRFPVIPIIITASRFYSVISLWALRARMYDYILLPDESARLLEQINNLLSLIDKNKVKRKPRFIHHASDPTSIVKVAIKNNQRTEQAIELINSKFNDKLRIEELASACDMKIETFARFFKIEHGMPPRDYIKKFRINVAKQMLTNKTNVQVVAQAIGYEDASHFSRVFKEAVGVTPSKFREK